MKLGWFLDGGWFGASGWFGTGYTEQTVSTTTWTEDF